MANFNETIKIFFDDHGHLENMDNQSILVVGNDKVNIIDIYVPFSLETVACSLSFKRNDGFLVREKTAERQEGLFEENGTNYVIYQKIIESKDQILSVGGSLDLTIKLMADDDYIAGDLKTKAATSLILFVNKAVATEGEVNFADQVYVEVQEELNAMRGSVNNNKNQIETHNLQISSIFQTNENQDDDISELNETAADHETRLVRVESISDDLSERMPIAEDFIASNVTRIDHVENKNQEQDIYLNSLDQTITTHGLNIESLSQSKQDNLTAGRNIVIENNVISAEKLSASFVFENESEMFSYIANNRDDLKIGDEILIKDINTPDYWWTGTEIAPLEASTPIKSGYVIERGEKKYNKLTEAQVLELYEFLADGIYKVNTIEHGDELVTIDHASTTIRRDFTKGLQVYDFNNSDFGWVELGGGASGSGGGIATRIIITPISSLSPSVAVGSNYSIYFKWATTSTTKQGRAELYVSDRLVATKQTTANRETSFNISNFIIEGSFNVRIKITDYDGNDNSIVYVVKGIKIDISSTFNENQIFSTTNPVVCQIKVTGETNKTLHLIVDGEEQEPELITNNSFNPINVNLSRHGRHNIRLYATVQLTENGETTTITTKELSYNIIYDGGESIPIIVTDFADNQTFIEGQTVAINFRAYTPKSQVSNVNFVVDGDVNQVLQNVTQAPQTIYFKNPLIAEDTKAIIYILSIPYEYETLPSDESFVTLNATIENVEVTIEPIATNLQLELLANGRSNNEEASLRNVWGFGEISAEMQNFNWSTNGWIDNKLVLNGDAKVVVPFKIFETNITQTGKTIEFDFEIVDVTDYDKTLIKSYDNFKGLFIKANECVLKSSQSTIKVNFKENERLKVTFVVEQSGTQTKLIKTYLNGVLSGLDQYTISDSFKQTTPTDIILNPDNGSVNINSIRVYNVALTADEVLQNYNADILEPAAKIEFYKKNLITTSSGNVSYDYVKELIPTVLFIGNLPTVKGNKTICTVNYYNPFNSSDNFEFNGCSVDVQGTSSVGFPRKNYKVKFPQAFDFFKNEITENTYTLKADYMQSSHTNNTQNARFINSLYGVNGSTYFPTRTATNGVRDAIDGFPICVFQEQNGVKTYYGVYNFNNDKGNANTFGLFGNNSESWEFKNNGSDRCNFLTNDFSSDVADDFEARYPKNSTNYTNLERVVSWVYSTKDNITKFKTEFNQYFNKEYCLIYYIMMDVLLAVDSRAKNMFLDTVDGIIWYPRWYDIDTTYGLDNEGHMKFGFDLEQRDPFGSGYVYNGNRSILWNNFETAFADDIAAKYNALRNNGVLSYENLMSYLNDDAIDKISKSMYNTDADFKYIKPLEENNNASFLYIAQGDMLSHLKWWVYNRFNYLDSKYNASDYKTNMITMRIYTPTENQNNSAEQNQAIQASNNVVAPNGDFNITLSSGGYISVLYGANGTMVKARSTKPNEPTLIECPRNLTLNDTEVFIYGADKITDLGDLSNKYAGSFDFTKATQLTNLKLGNDNSSYNNQNLTSLIIGNNNLLQSVDIQNCSNLSQAIDFSGCLNIQEIKAKGTNIPTIVLPEGGNLKTLILPTSITTLSIKNQPNLTTLTLPMHNSQYNLTRLVFEFVEGVEMSSSVRGALLNILRFANLEAIRITNLNLTISSSYDYILNRLLNVDGISTNEAILDNQPIITGHIHFTGTINNLQLQEWNNKFPDLTITADEIVNAYTVIFKDWDDSILQISYVNEGTLAVYEGEEPTKESQGGISYKFGGWKDQETNLSFNLTTPITKDIILVAMLVELTDQTWDIVTTTENFSCRFTVSSGDMSLSSLFNLLQVDWGDGQLDNINRTNYSININHTFENEGIYKIKTIANIKQGATPSRASVYIEGVTNQPYIIKNATISSTIPNLYLQGYQNAQITNINIPSNVIGFAQYCFMNCQNLSSIEIPESVTSIGPYVFSNCSNLTSIVIPGSVLVIDGGAFSGCSSLTSIEIPESVTRIGFSAFNKCSNLTSIEIPESVTSIGGSAFYNCSLLRKVILNSVVPPSLGSSAFSGTSSGLEIYVPDESVNDYKTATNWTSYASKIYAVSALEQN